MYLITYRFTISHIAYLEINFLDCNCVRLALLHLSWKVEGTELSCSDPGPFCILDDIWLQVCRHIYLETREWTLRRLLLSSSGRDQEYCKMTHKAQCITLFPLHTHYRKHGVTNKVGELNRTQSDKEAVMESISLHENKRIINKNNNTNHQYWLRICSRFIQGKLSEWELTSSSFLFSIIY